MPQIEVDTERALAYIKEVGREFEVNEARATQQQEKRSEQVENSDHDPGAWGTVADKAADAIATKLCPNWEITQDEKSWWSGSVAECLDHFFPGALEGFDNWHPIAKVIGASAAIAALRISFDDGGFIPLHEPKKDTKNGDAEPAGRTLDIDNGENSKRQNSGSFTTSGE